MSTDIQTKMVLVIGTNGTGKTTLARKLLEGVECARKLVVTQHLSEWSYLPENPLSSPSDLAFTGTNWHLVLDEKTIFKRLNQFYNGVLLLDDCMNYMPPQTDMDVKRLYIGRRQRANHIIMVAHGITEVPPKAFTFATDIFLGATRDNPDSTRKNTIQNFDQFVSIQRKVNEAARTNWHHFEHISY